MSEDDDYDRDVIKRSISHISHCTKIARINKGFSTDQKYIVPCKDGSTYLLRISDIQQYAEKQAEFNVIKQLEQYEVKCSKAIAFGKLHEMDACYMLLTYIDGHDASEQLPTYSEDEQYEIGLAAGEQLAKMHQYPAPEHISPWYDRRLKKYRKQIEAYRKCGVRVKWDEKIISFIEDHIGLMKGRPNLFQHDDFHVGNIIVKERRFAGTIDFNRYDWGDPLHEFLKLAMFSREVSIPFSIGQIVGYCRNRPSENMFWPLYALYVAMSVFPSVVWTLNVIPDKLNEMLDKVYMMVEDHQYFESIKPSWYK